MFQAVWGDTVLAEAEHTVVVEGNHYFPPESLRRKYFLPSGLRTLCFWKGIARYYHVSVEGQIHRNMAWHYPHPTPLARSMRNHVAFSPGTTIKETP